MYSDQSTNHSFQTVVFFTFDQSQLELSRQLRDVAESLIGLVVRLVVAVGCAEGEVFGIAGET
jgi:hypothetical protein